MRLRNIPTARSELAQSGYVICEEIISSYRGNWADTFDTLRSSMSPSGEDAPHCLNTGHDSGTGALDDGRPDVSAVRGTVKNDTGIQAGKYGGRPLYVEIGMGKGRFLLEMAHLHPDIDFIGIEQYSSVLVHAVRRLEQMKSEGSPLTNVLLLRANAEYLTDYFAEGEVNRIYLNFSDPWPKDRHAKRRLPGRVFLGRYSRILAPGGTVEFKTDNRVLFDYALEEAESTGWTLDLVTYDLHHDSDLMKDNVMTEYEEKFSAKGNPICKLIMRP